MAAATSKLVVNAFPYGSTTSQSQTTLFGTLQLSVGGTYVTNGVPISWQFFNPDGSTFPAPYGPQTTDPIVAYFTSAIGGVICAAPAGLQTYIYDNVHNTLRIYANTELANNAAITADTITFEVHFAKGV